MTYIRKMRPFGAGTRALVPDGIAADLEAGAEILPEPPSWPPRSRVGEDDDWAAPRYLECHPGLGGALGYVRFLCSAGELDPLTVLILQECYLIDTRSDLTFAERRSLKDVYFACPTHGPEAKQIRLFVRCEFVTALHEDFYLEPRRRARKPARSYTADAKDIYTRLCGHDVTRLIDPIAEPRMAFEREIINLSDDSDLGGGAEMIRRTISGAGFRPKVEFRSLPTIVRK